MAASFSKALPCREQFDFTSAHVINAKYVRMCTSGYCFNLLASFLLDQTQNLWPVYLAFSRFL